MIRVGRGFAGLLAAVLLFPSAALAAERVSIGEVKAEDFPEVTMTISVDGGTNVDDLAITEDGQEVADVEIAPLGESNAGVDVVLLVDTSGSMKPARSTAISAAKSFVKELPSEVRIGVVSFADSATVEQDLTSDKRVVLDALGGLETTGETALYDGVDTALGLFASDAQRNIVLLSDGGDTASRASLGEITSAASRADTAIYSIALETPETDKDALRLLSGSSGGSYLSTATDDLRSVYGKIASTLSQQYLVSYTSEAGGDTEIELGVSGPGGSDSFVFETPADAPRAPAPSQVEPPAPPLRLDVAWMLVVVLALTFGAAFFLALVLFGGRYRRRRKRRLQAAAEIKLPSSEGRPQRDGGSLIPESLVDRAQRIAERQGFSDSLRLRLDQAGVSLRTGEFLAGSALLALGGYLLASLLFGNPLAGLLTAAAGVFIPLVILTFKMKRRTKRMHSQLSDALSILASSLRAGHSFVQSLNLVAQEIGEPSATEYRRLLAELRLGRELNDALDALAERVGSEDFRWAILAVKIQRDVGGNLAEVLDTVADTLREREAVAGQVKALSAEGRLSMYLLCGLPPGVAAYMFMVNPEYISLLWTTRMGMIMLAVGGSLMALGIVWMRKVVRIDV
jgi:tight adherence protein B